MVGKIGIVFVVNMSVGVNVMLKLFEFVVKYFLYGYDIEIIEVYYCYKVDVLLGIVLMMGEVVVGVFGCLFDDCVVYGCYGVMGECDLLLIGFVVVCGGDIVGDYIVLFVGIGECIEIMYKLLSCVLYV